LEEGRLSERSPSKNTTKEPKVNSETTDPDVGQILKAAGVYFAVVFGIGFVLGVIRVLWVGPFLGIRNAELLEQPLMLIAVFLTARWVVLQFGGKLSRTEILSIGLIALSILILTEVMVVLFLQPVRAGDALSGVAYFLNLGMFAIMPWLVSLARSTSKREEHSEVRSVPH
jgi:hypothetical protein